MGVARAGLAAFGIVDLGNLSLGFSLVNLPYKLVILHGFAFIHEPRVVQSLLLL